MESVYVFVSIPLLKGELPCILQNELLAFCQSREIDKAVAKLKQHILSSRDEIKAFLQQREQLKS